VLSGLPSYWGLTLSRDLTQRVVFFDLNPSRLIDFFFVIFPRFTRMEDILIRSSIPRKKIPVGRQPYQREERLSYSSSQTCTPPYFTVHFFHAGASTSNLDTKCFGFDSYLRRAFFFGRCSVAYKSYNPCFHVFLMEAGVMTHCTCRILPLSAEQAYLKH